ncbi:MAG: DUF192 domain-containing protein [Hyphomonadaceae bacterium]
MKNLAAIAVTSLLFALPAFAQGATEKLTIASGDKTHTINVELADTPDEIAKGLTGRATLAADHGMLLDMRALPQAAPLTMRGVQVELDLLFLAPDGKIVAIVQHARAGSLRPLDPGLRSVAIVEIPGGQAAALGIKPGDKAEHRILGHAG